MNVLKTKNAIPAFVAVAMAGCSSLLPEKSIDQVFKEVSDCNTPYKPHPKAQSLAADVLEKLIANEATAGMAEDFIKNDAKICITDDKRYPVRTLGHAHAEENYFMVRYQNDIHQMLVTSAHEMGHIDHVHKFGSRRAVSAITFRPYAHLLKVRAGEASAQTIATEFAYNELVNGNIGPMRSIFVGGNYDAHMARAYLTALHEDQMDQLSEMTIDEALEKLSYSAQKPSGDRLAKARAASFVSFYEIKMPYGVYTKNNLYNISLMDIGRDDWVGGYVSGEPINRNIGRITLEDVDLSRYTEINGENYAYALPPRSEFLTLMRHGLHGHDLWYFDTYDTAIDRYLEDGTYPVNSFDENIVIYSPEEKKEFLSSPYYNGFYGGVEISQYFKAKKEGYLDDFHLYAQAVKADIVGYAFAPKSYIQGCKLGLAPPLQDENGRDIKHDDVKSKIASHHGLSNRYVAEEAYLLDYATKQTHDSNIRMQADTLMQEAAKFIEAGRIGVMSPYPFIASDVLEGAIEILYGTKEEFQALEEIDLNSASDDQILKRQFFEQTKDVRKAFVEAVLSWRKAQELVHKPAISTDLAL